MIEVTSEVSGDADTENIKLIGFRPGPAGAWVAVITGEVKVDGNLVEVTKEFAQVPASVRNWLNSTGLPMSKTALKAAL